MKIETVAKMKHQSELNISSIQGNSTIKEKGTGVPITMAETNNCFHATILWKPTF
jgi:hypothetical protein